nr:LysR family transcriptional regulator [Providencia stuartii]
MERTPRQVRLSAFGENFLDYAKDLLIAHDRALESLNSIERKFKLGISCYAMGPEVSSILSQLNSLDSVNLIEVNIQTSEIILQEFNEGNLDAVIVRSTDDRREGTILSPDNFGWFASSDFSSFPNQPLPLANLSADCATSGQATKLLNQAGIEYKEVFVGGGLPALISAISSGIAIGILPYRLAPSHFVEISGKLSLPEIPSVNIVLHSALSDRKSRKISQTIEKIYKEQFFN